MKLAQVQFFLCLWTRVEIKQLLEGRAGIVSMVAIFNDFDVFEQNIQYYPNRTKSWNQIQVCGSSKTIAKLPILNQTSLVWQISHS